MPAQPDRWSRADWARWFIEHDDVDEAARVLESGDELVVGESGFHDLAAALERRGLTAIYADGTLRVGGPGSRVRRPPVRAATPIGADRAGSKKRSA